MTKTYDITPPKGTRVNDGPETAFEDGVRWKGTYINDGKVRTKPVPSPAPNAKVTPIK